MLSNLNLLTYFNLFLEESKHRLNYYSLKSQKNSIKLLIMYKKFLNLVLLFLTFFGLMIASIRLPVFATTLQIQTNFQDSNAIWLNKNNNNSNNSVADSPYRITNIINETPYQFLMSVGAYVSGNPDRVILGAFSSTVTGYYNLTHNSLLSPFAALTNAKYPAVIVLNQDLYFQKVTSLSYAYAYGTSGDTHTITPIYSTNKGTTWQKAPASSTFTTSGSANTIPFDNLSYTSVYLRVGVLFENTNNQDAMNMSNPVLSLNFESMENAAQANEFASMIEDYSPCADIENGMTQLTSQKQNELVHLYSQLSNGAKLELNAIEMGIGFTAAQRYQYLISFNL